MRTSRTFRLTGLAILLGAILCAVPVSGVRALGICILVFGVPVFAVSATRYLLSGLLWRVGSRLFVSYLLLLSAVVFAVFFVYAGVLIVAGQLGTRRVEAALAKHPRSGCSGSRRAEPSKGPAPRPLPTSPRGPG